MNCYPTVFAALRERGEDASVPFIMVGDPDPDTSRAVIKALIAGGADAFEPGVSFIDSVVDGPIIQKAHVQALAASVGFQDCPKVVRQVCRCHPWLPTGVLIYGNAPFVMGLERFYSECAQVGIDSVLLSNVPIRELVAFSRAAEEAGADAVYIVPPSAAAETLDAVAAVSRGYVRVAPRVEVTGTERASSTVGLAESVERPYADAVAPVVLGFGISTPEQIVEIIVVGADGAISGPATARIVERYTPEIMAVISNNNGAGGNEKHRHYTLGALHSNLVAFAVMMKEATRPH